MCRSLHDSGGGVLVERSNEASFLRWVGDCGLHTQSVCVHLAFRCGRSSRRLGERQGLDADDGGGSWFLEKRIRCYDVMMRTTIDLDEELLRTAKSISELKGQTLSRVVSELAWKGLRAETAGGGFRNGFPVLPLRGGSRPVTPQHVAEMLELEDEGNDEGGGGRR
jgi:hypothetical protein